MTHFETLMFWISQIHASPRATFETIKRWTSSLKVRDMHGPTKSKVDLHFPKKLASQNVNQVMGYKWSAQERYECHLFTLPFFSTYLSIVIFCMRVKLWKRLSSFPFFDIRRITLT
jgi:hypothetical protein